MTLVGLGNLSAAALMLRRHAYEHHAVLAAGVLLSGYIIGEMYLLQTAHWLQLVYLVIGLSTMALGFWLTFLSRRGVPRRRHTTHLANTI